MNSNVLALVFGAILLVIASATAAVYMARTPSSAPAAERAVTVTKVTAPTRTQQHVAVKKCDDGNIAGKAVGGVAGGVLGSTVGKGSGKTAATIAGTLGGAVVGGEAIPLNNVTCQ